MLRYAVHVDRQYVRKLILVVPFVLFQFPVLHSFMSPVLLVVGASRGVVTASMLIYLVLFLASLVFGRGFCAWFCPAALIQEACTALGAKPLAKGKKYRLKYFLAVGLYCAVAIAALRAGGFHRLDWHFGGIGNAPAPMIMRVGAFVILIPLSFLIGRWAFCHHLCWIAPLMIVGDRIRSRLHLPGLRLLSHASACSNCESCETACPMSLPIVDMVSKQNMRNAECILCGGCADACPSGAIELQFSKWK